MRRDFDNPDSKALARAEVEARHYQDNLEFALQQPGFDPDIIANYRRWAIEALIVLGELNRASELVKDEPSVVDLAKEIEEIQAGLAMNDERRCNCEHIIDGVQFPHMTRGRRVRKPDGTVARVHKCNLCRFTNVFVGHADDLHASAHSHRQSIEKVFQKGKATPPQTPDAILLKNAAETTNRI